MSAVPPAPGYFSDDSHNPLNAPGFDPNMPRRGLVNQVRVVAILNAAQGALELLVAMVCLFGGTVLLIVPIEMQQGGPNPAVLSAIYFVAGSVHLILGSLRLLAAWRNYFFQNRVLGIVSLCAGLISTFAGCCAITSLGVAVYGLIVFFDAAVIDAFHRRSQGASIEDCLGQRSSPPAPLA